jgi:hypothetical protein
MMLLNIADRFRIYDLKLYLLLKLTICLFTCLFIYLFILLQLLLILKSISFDEKIKIDKFEHIYYIFTLIFLFIE